jgi:hypothetical protein
MSDAVLREVVETLARLERGAGSRGETEAADWLARRLTAAGADARIEAVRFLDGYARALVPLGIAGTAAGAIALSGRGRRLAALVATLGGLATADDIDNRRRVWRRLISKPRATTNVIAEVGDADAERTLVVLAHHDAAPTGAIFDPSLQRKIARRFPDLVARTDTSLPLWWPTLVAPLLIALGAISGRRAVLAAGTALGVGTAALGVDIARHRIVPGANDNLSACAALVALAERLRERPVPGLRVMLVSCGAEEVLQGGIYDFVERRLKRLDPATTRVLNLDTVGSPRLVMLEGEGVLLKVEDYAGPAFRDLIADTAESERIQLVRNQRARASTDSVVPSRAGYPTATLISFEPDTKLLSNYHLPTDTPENLDYSTVLEAVRLTEAVARRLAPGMQQAWTPAG